MYDDRYNQTNEHRSKQVKVFIRIINYQPADAGRSLLYY